jgi:hypothetical protein
VNKLEKFGVVLMLIAGRFAPSDLMAFFFVFVLGWLFFFFSDELLQHK